MRTFADVKRRCTPGTRLEVIAQTKRPGLVGSVRTVTATTPSQLHFRSAPGNGGDVFITAWPAARDVRIIDADTFEYDLPHPGRGCIIRLRFLPAPEEAPNG